jgi:hypothetical protein
MPQPVADGEQATPIVARKRFVVLVQVGDVGKCRRQPSVLGSPQTGADGKLDGADGSSEVQLLLVREVLIVKDQRGVLVHAGVNCGNRPCRHGLGEIEPVDLADEARSNLTDRKRHRQQAPTHP